MILQSKKYLNDDEIKSILEEEVYSWFKKKFKKFSLTQRYAFYELKENKNLLISSPTGSGKTLSAFLLIIDKLLKLSKSKKLENKVYAIYISPLRALNNDIEKNLMVPLRGIQKLNPEFKINIAVRTSDTTPYQKSKMLKHVPNILITTPESFALILNSPKFMKLIRNVEYVIIDEIHSLASNKRGAHLSLALERLAHVKEFIRIGLSATVYPLEEVAKYLVGINRSCSIVDINYMKQIDVNVESILNLDLNITEEKLYKRLHELISNHNSTLIFTNTRASTERVVYNLKKRYNYKKIGAHHSSLSRKTRLDIEQKLKNGELEVVVSSTSLELGIDIGHIDLVILLTSPKSVSRAVQRIGRSGHKLEDESKGIMIVLNPDDLIECTIIKYNIKQRKYEPIHIIHNPLDVLTQHILGMALNKDWNIEDAFKLIKRSYNFHTLKRRDFEDILNYLSGYYELEERNVYAKIWKKDKKFGRIGKTGRIIYMMNIGTIPENTLINVFNYKTNEFLGKVEEQFVEQLIKNDIFVLGGKTYQFIQSNVNSIYVLPIKDVRPNIPNWYSEMLPLPYELARDIEKHITNIANKTIKQISQTYQIPLNAARILKKYINLQRNNSHLPTNEQLVIEEFIDEKGIRNYIFHTVVGRRVNEALARSFSNAIGEKYFINVKLTVSDYGFVISMGRWKHLRKNDIVELINMDKNKFTKHAIHSIERSELYVRKFREVASRSYLILKRYPTKTKNVHERQFLAKSLLKLLNLFYKDFPLIREVKREILEDKLDIKNALSFLTELRSRDIIFERAKEEPSPFAMNILAGHNDILSMEENISILKRVFGEINENNHV